MQYGVKLVIFKYLAKQKRQYKENQWGFFSSVSSFEKLRDSSLTYFPVFMVLYLYVTENINQTHFSITTSLE